MRLILTLTIIAFLGFCGTRIVKNIQYNQDCGGHLKRAADANTVNLAKDELTIAIHYIEDNDLTDGYTSILYNTPDEDMKFWYNNIKASYIELDQIDSTTTQLETSNILIKLRETLLDHTGQGGDKVTAPDGISVYPNNTGYMLWGLLSFISICIACILWFQYGDY